MNRVKKKSAGSFVLLKKKKVKKQQVPDERDNDSYDSMVDNGTDEDDDDDGDVSIAGDGNDSMDSGLESGALVRTAKPPKKSASKAMKRKVTAHNDEEVHRKRVKEMKALYKPPTVEEINRLKETENYYHSNLFRMQTEEMLKEVRVSSKLGRFVQVWLEQFKEFLQTIENETNARSLLELDYDGFEFPMKAAGSQYMQEVLGKERFRFLQQRHVRTIGGCDSMLRTTFGKPLVVDLLLVMPDKCLHKEDYLNLRYHYKRAHYLCTIAQHLLQQSSSDGEEKIVSNVRFEPLKGDRLKPVLLMIPADATFSRKVHFQLHAVADATSFPKKRFLPHRNNVRPAMIGSGEPGSTEEYENFPTPHYNTSILYDVRLAKNAELLESIIQSDSIREAIILLKVWIRQRHFDRGRYAFDGAIVTFYIAYLLQNRRIYPKMSSYQIIRLFWNQLAGSSWDKEGITFDNSSRETLLSFFRYYEVVFIDPLGLLNIAANLPVDLYRRVRHESALAIRVLDNPKINSFLPLFLANYPAFTQYDHIITIQGSKMIAATIESFAEDVDKLDYLGDSQALLTRMVERLLRKGLGTRASYLVPLAANLKLDEPAMTAEPRLMLGLSLNGTDAFNLVDKGPEAIDTVASEAFRSFWQGKAELRRFKDGSITESCVWGEPTDPIGQKRLIVRSIVQFLLQAHLDIPDNNVRYLADQFEHAIAPFPKKTLHETIEERSLAVIRTFDTLGRMMRDLEKLPLTINAILGTDAVFRYTDPDPPRPTARALMVNGRLVFLSAKPIHATIQLEASGKWPADLEAIRRLKTAFYLRIADSIGQEPGQETSTSKPLAQACNDYLDVLYEQYLFRFVIVHQREITILREYLSENKVTRLQQDTDESIALEMQATILPKLTGILHGLHQQYFSFGSVAAIAKRWLYSQLIDPYLWPDECTELLLAAIYLNQPVQPPIQPQTGFLRWLQFVASTDWSKDMIVVNLNDELASETIEQVEKQFYDRRQSFPPLTIVTPADSGKYGLFGRRAPTVEILNRVTLLAQAATQLIDANYRSLQKIQQFFQPSLEGYNLIIHLDTTIITPIGIRKSKEMALHSAPSLYAKANNTDPAAGFYPVRFYLQELREAYRQFAIFFYDPCGGDRIAVLWRPQALEEKPFSTTHVNGRMVTEHEALHLNVDALVRDFELLGQGLVSRIERRQ
ncbi:nucleolar protein 6 [Anopheles maculipalpis]|uniref:nucleolar protein 6 n=1 Tax=Anopheles maculipalpis TaxID=1496333 RepID=UPI002158C6A9|nr:nucleolar protein 6 [Anopheles maculipalpis]